MRNPFLMLFSRLKRRITHLAIFFGDSFEIMQKRTKSVAAINVDKMTLKDLLSLEAQLGPAIAAARDRERQDLRRKMESLAAAQGFSVSELFGGVRGKGKVSVAKYANPDNRSETWTGRGRKPNWLVAKLKKGSKLADFSI